MNITEFNKEKTNFDVLVIGGGPGGYVAALRAAQLGLDTLLVEKDKLGGTCLNRGCIPTKSFLASAKVLKTVSEASVFGIDVTDISFDFNRIVERKDSVVEGLRQGVSQLLEKRKVTTLFGTARFMDEHTVLVSDEQGEIKVSAANIILSAGSRTLCPGPLKPDGQRIITSTEALEEKELPDSIAIVGGGVIGCEFASVYSSFNVKTTIIEGMPSILPREEKPTSAFLRTAFKKQGVTIKTKSMVQSMEKTESGVRIILDKGEPIEAEKVLVAIGRAPIEDDLGIAELGIITDERGFVRVDEKMRTNIKHIYCIGDMTGEWLLAHSASYGGVVAAHNCAGQDMTADFTVVPNCIFTLPEISSVGMNEAECKKMGIETVSGKFPFAASGKARAEGHDQGFVKVVAEKSTNTIIGCTIAGDGASNLIAEMALAIKNKLTLEDVAHTIHAHPSLPETVVESCEKALGYPIHTLVVSALVLGLSFLMSLFSCFAPLMNNVFAQTADNAYARPLVTNTAAPNAEAAETRAGLRSFKVENLAILSNIKPGDQVHDTIVKPGMIFKSAVAGVEEGQLLSSKPTFLSIHAVYEGKALPVGYSIQIKGTLEKGVFRCDYSLDELLRNLDFFDSKFKLPPNPENLTYEIKSVNARQFKGGTDFRIDFSVLSAKAVFNSSVSYFVTTRIKALASVKLGFETIFKYIAQFTQDPDFNALIDINLEVLAENDPNTEDIKPMEFDFLPPMTSVEHVLLGRPASGSAVPFRFKITESESRIILTGGLLSRFSKMDFVATLTESGVFKKMYTNQALNRIFGSFSKKDSTWKVNIIKDKGWFEISGKSVKYIEG